MCVCVCGRVKHLFYIRAEQAESWRRTGVGGIRDNLLIWSKKSFNHRSCDCKWICSLSSALIEEPAGGHPAVRRLRAWGPGSVADILCHCCYIRKNCIRGNLLAVSFFLYKGNYRPGRGKWSGDLRCQFCFACCSVAHVDVETNRLSHTPYMSRIPVWTRWLFSCGCFSCNKTVIIDRSILQVRHREPRASGVLRVCVCVVLWSGAADVDIVIHYIPKTRQGPSDCHEC